MASANAAEIAVLSPRVIAAELLLDVVRCSHSKRKGVTVCLLEAGTVLPGFRKRHWKTIDADVNYLSSTWQPWPPALAGGVSS